MLTKFPFKQNIEAFLEVTSAKEQYRLGIFWCVIFLSVMILGFTSYHIQTIPEKIAVNIDRALDNRTWIQKYVVVDGQHVYLRGEVEPDSGLENEIAIISNVPGVSQVSNILDEIPKPSLYFNLKKSEDELVASGVLSGEFLEPIISHIETSFPDHRLKDKLKIDDRLGRPLWFEGFDQSLSKLLELDDFEIHGWRDQIEITGSAESDLDRRQIGYAIPASLIDQVTVVNRLKQSVTENFSSITVISDWRGLYIEGVVPSIELRDQLLDATLNAFGVEKSNAALAIQSHLLDSHQLRLLSEFFPSLEQVRDLRLESTEKGYVVWGRVDDPVELGKILHSQNTLGLDQTIRNEIFISSAGKSASLTLFCDQTRVIINGVLPTIKSKQQLIEDIKLNLGVDEIVDLVSIEPNTAHSDWLEKWPDLLADLPKTVIGITIDDNALLVTGNTQTDKHVTQIDQRLSILFPNQTRFNWFTSSIH